MSSSSVSTTKKKIFFTTNMASRVFPCLLAASQSSSLSSVTKSSSTVDSSSTAIVQSQQSNSTAGHRVIQSKHELNKPLQSSSSVSVDHLNDLLDKHILDFQQPDITVTDDKNNESDEYEEVPVPLLPSALSPSVKRAFKGVSSGVSISTKRCKKNNKENVDVESDDDEKHGDEYSSSFQKKVLIKLKQGEIDGQYNRRMFEQLLTQHQRHEATQKLILENQKKIKKVLLKNKIYVDIEEEINPMEGARTDDDGNLYPSELPYSTDGGETNFDALHIHGDPMKKNLFALKLVDELFSEDELLELDPLTKKNELLSHPSYLFIKEAVRVKFRLTTAKLAIEWPNIHEAILNKRRNWKKDKKPVVTSHVIDA
ncbi:hypothetical protein I4U23_031315 [Adineta vaga]|nr:hypothetical protein I4U23_031315 [Adineta vaga]